MGSQYKQVRFERPLRVETVVKEAASGGHAEGGEEAALDLRLADGVQLIVGEALQFICFHHSVI